MDYTQCNLCGHTKDPHHHDGICEVKDCKPHDYSPSSGEAQTCPRRMGQFGPWEHKEQLDQWVGYHWNEYYVGKWPSKYDKPRTCSFCGAVHPDDAIKLLMEGWEVEATGKVYKRYLNPPGYADFINRISSQDAIDTQIFSPTPPVKVYTEHFTDEQIQRFNALMFRSRAV